MDLSVRFKTIRGDVDASGGLIFRYKDSGNYYVVKANSLEDNVVAYKTEAGRRNRMGPHPTPDSALKFMVRAGKARFDSHPDHPKK